jgi:hypothetical protein
MANILQVNIFLLGNLWDPQLLEVLSHRPFRGVQEDLVGLVIHLSQNHLLDLVVQLRQVHHLVLVLPYLYLFNARLRILYHLTCIPLSPGGPNGPGNP